MQEEYSRQRGVGEGRGWVTDRGKRQKIGGKPICAVEEERVAVSNEVANPLGERAIELKVHGQPHAVARREEDSPAAGVRHDGEHVRGEHGPVIDGQALGRPSRHDARGAGLPFRHLRRKVDFAPQLRLLPPPARVRQCAAAIPPPSPPSTKIF
jgi:hypothetical protein